MEKQETIHLEWVVEWKAAAFLLISKENVKFLWLWNAIMCSSVLWAFESFQHLIFFNWIQMHVNQKSTNFFDIIHILLSNHWKPLMCFEYWKYFFLWKFPGLWFDSRKIKTCIYTTRSSSKFHISIFHGKSESEILSRHCEIFWIHKFSHIVWRLHIHEP